MAGMKGSKMENNLCKSRLAIVLPSLNPDEKFGAVVGGLLESGFEKRIKFIPKSIVSSGEVKISADDSVVIFYEKTFRVNNSSITGRIMYDDGTGFKTVPANSFIPLEMLPTYNRIGTVAVNEDGNFEIRLRSEYKYDWNLDNVKFQFTDEDGNIYEKEYDSLEDLYTDRNTIVLKKIS